MTLCSVNTTLALMHRAAAHPHSSLAFQDLPASIPMKAPFSSELSANRIIQTEQVWRQASRTAWVHTQT